MKKICCIVFVGLFVLSCSSDDPLESTPVSDLMLINIKKNSMMTDEAFDRTFQILEAQGSLSVMVAKYKTRDSFIAKMEELTKDVVPESVARIGFIGGWGNSVYQSSGPSQSSAILKDFIADAGEGLEGSSPGTGVLDRYSKQVDEQLEVRQGEQMIIQSYSLGPPAAQANPTEEVSFNYANILRVKQSIESLVLQFPDDADLDREIDEYTAANESSEILIGLLLPAIQKVRESSTATKNSYEKMNDLIFGSTTPSAERTRWNQRMKQAALLAAVSMIVSENFNNENENFASVEVQAEMHHAVSVIAWARIDDTNR